MKSNKLALILFSLLFTLTPTHAGVLVEPYVGYAIGSAEFSNADWDYKTIQPGARLGYQFMGLMAGVDYSTAKFDLDFEHKTTGATATFSDFKKTQLGVFVGYNLPVLLRVWGTYFLNAEAEYPGDGQANSDFKYNGGGYGLGAGFTALPFLSINLEYRMYKYDEAEQGGITAALAEELEFNEIFLSVSLPLNI